MSVSTPVPPPWEPLGDRVLVIDLHTPLTDGARVCRVLRISQVAVADFMEEDVVLLGRYCGEDLPGDKILVRVEDIIAVRRANPARGEKREEGT